MKRTIEELVTPCPCCAARIIVLTITSRMPEQLAWSGRCDECGYRVQMFAAPVAVRTVA